MTVTKDDVILSVSEESQRTVGPFAKAQGDERAMGPFAKAQGDERAMGPFAGSG